MTSPGANDFGLSDYSQGRPCMAPGGVTVETLNEIVELELAGVVRFTQYSLMVFGHARIPIMHWMRE